MVTCQDNSAHKTKQNKNPQNKRQPEELDLNLKKTDSISWFFSTFKKKVLECFKGRHHKNGNTKVKWSTSFPQHHWCKYQLLRQHKYSPSLSSTSTHLKSFIIAYLVLLYLHMFIFIWLSLYVTVLQTVFLFITECSWVFMCHRAHVVVIRNLVGVSFLLLLCGFQG